MSTAQLSESLGCTSIGAATVQQPILGQGERRLARLVARSATVDCDYDDDSDDDDGDDNDVN